MRIIGNEGERKRGRESKRQRGEAQKRQDKNGLAMDQVRLTLGDRHIQPIEDMGLTMADDLKISYISVASVSHRGMVDVLSFSLTTWVPQRETERESRGREAHRHQHARSHARTSPHASLSHARTGPHARPLHASTRTGSPTSACAQTRGHGMHAHKCTCEPLKHASTPLHVSRHTTTQASGHANMQACERDQDECT